MEWVYKAADTKLDFVGTMLLANKDGFLCRSAYEDSTRTWADNVRQVRAGDTIHFYFRHRNGKIAGLGSFKVVVPTEDHPRAGAFGESVAGTALFKVADPAFIEKRDPSRAYKVDPIIGQYTGWPLKRIGKAPPYQARMFKNMTTLQRYGETP